MPKTTPTSDRILLRCADECGSIHSWWLEPRAGWHFLVGHRPEDFRDWSLPRGYALDRIKFASNKGAFAHQFFSVRVQRTAAGEA